MSFRLTLAATLIAGLLATAVTARFTGDSLSAAVIVLIFLVTAAALLAPSTTERRAPQRR